MSTTSANLSRKRKAELEATRASTVEGQLELLKQYEESWKVSDFKRCVAISTALIDANASQPRPNFFVQRARANLELSRLPEVITDTERAISLQPLNSKAFALQGYANFLLVESLRRHAIQSKQAADVSQTKWTARLQEAIRALEHARELDPSIQSNETFSRYWDLCERERLVLEDSSSYEAPSFLASLIGSAASSSTEKIASQNANNTRETRGEEAVLLRMNNANHLIPTMHDTIFLKSELLFFLASLSRRCFQYTSPTYLDTVRHVRTINEFREAFIRAEAKLGYEVQLKSWQSDRPAWLTGVRLASSPGELFVALRSLRASMRSSEFELRPDRLVQQVKAFVNDLETIGDVNLGSFHQGECRGICISLLSKGIEEVPPEFSCALAISKGRTLVTAERIPEAVEVFNQIVNVYNNGHCSKNDLDHALASREAAAKRSLKHAELKATFVEPLPNVVPEIVLTPLGNGSAFYNKPLSASSQLVPPSKLTPTVSNETIDELWNILAQSDKEAACTVALDQLERALPPAVLRKLSSALLAVGTNKDLLELYRDPVSAKAAFSVTSATEKQPQIQSEDLMQDGRAITVMGMTAQMQKDNPAEHDFWSGFETTVADLITKNTQLSNLLIKRHPDLGESVLYRKASPLEFSLPPSHPPVTSPIFGGGAHQDDLKMAAADHLLVEYNILRQRERAPVGFDHQVYTGGWISDRPNIIAPFSSLSTVDGEQPDPDPQLLFEEVYCVHPELSPTTSTFKGTLVSDLCARVCYRNLPSAHVGRSLLNSECPSSSCLMNDARLCITPRIDRAGKQALKVYVMETSVRDFLRYKTVATVQQALRDHLLTGDDEDVLVKRLNQASEEVRQSELDFRRAERLKWGFEQIRVALQAATVTQKLFASRHDEKSTREVEEFANRSVELHRVLTQCREAKLLSVNDAVAAALTGCSEAIHERDQVRYTLNEARANLAMDEERLQQLSGLSLHTRLFDPLHIMQQQFFRGDDEAKLQSAVIGRTQAVQLLETRLSEMDAMVVNASIHFFKIAGQLVRGKTDFVLAQLTAFELSQLANEIPLTELDLLRIAKAKSLVSNSGGTNDDESFRDRILSGTSSNLMSLARAAALLLASYPKSISEEFVAIDDVDAAWRELDAAAERARSFTLSMYTDQLVSKGQAQHLLKAFAVAVNVVQELNQLVTRQRQSLAEAITRERWRRAELLRYVHVRNQVLYGALAQIILDQLHDLRNRELREQFERQLMDEEDQQKKKQEKKSNNGNNSSNNNNNSRKKKAVAAANPITTMAPTVKDASPAGNVSSALVNGGSTRNNSEEKMSSSITAVKVVSVTESGQEANGQTQPKLEQQQQQQEQASISDLRTATVSTTTAQKADSIVAAHEEDDESAWTTVGQSKKAHHPVASAKSTRNVSNGTSVKTPAQNKPAKPQPAIAMPTTLMQANATAQQKKLSTDTGMLGMANGNGKTTIATKPKVGSRRVEVAVLKKENTISSAAKIEPKKESMAPADKVPAMSSASDSSSNDEPSPTSPPRVVEVTSLKKFEDLTANVLFGDFDSSEPDQVSGVGQGSASEDGVIAKKGVDDHEGQAEVAVAAEEEDDGDDTTAHSTGEGELMSNFSQSPPYSGPFIINENVHGPPLHPLAHAALPGQFAPPFPPNWICPLTREVMSDPVVASDGHTYERAAITRYLNGQPLPVPSPVTGNMIEDNYLDPNHPLRMVIQEGMMHFRRPMPMFPIHQAQPPPAPMPQRPICMYFQQGTCRYGPGCRNLHLLVNTPPLPPPPPSSLVHAQPPVFMHFAPPLSGPAPAFMQQVPPPPMSSSPSQSPPFTPAVVASPPPPPQQGM